MGSIEPRASRIPGADGIELALYEWSSEGVPLLLLHGFGNSARIWDDFAPAVAAHYRTLAIDLRGHGDSARDPEGRYDHLSMARDVEAVCERLGFARLVLVGHSLGGRVALRFAGRNPEKLAGLVIVDSGPELDARGTSRIRNETETREPTFASLRAYEDVLVQNYPATKPAALARLARHWSRQRPDGRWELKLDPSFFRRRTGDADPEGWLRAETQALWDALKLVPCPTLVVRGAASDVLDADVADRMVDEVLQKGQLAVVAGAGHSVMTDNPDGFRDAVCAFALGD